jgi:hypothetical protein
MSVHELLAGSGPWWAWAMFIGAAVLLAVIVVIIVLGLTDRL